MMVGDSLTEFGAWGVLFPDADIVNVGVAGARTVDIVERIDGIIATGASTALIMMGVNDSALGEPLHEVITNYVRVVERLLAVGMRVVIQATLKINAQIRSRTDADRVNRAIDELNDAMRSYAGEHGIEFIDINNRAAPAGEMRAELTYDGTHLTLEGYALWCDAIRHIIDTR